MAIAGRTPSTGTAASSAGFSITLPTGFATGDIVVLAVANAGTTGPTAPTGWTKTGTYSAGTGQAICLYWAPYSAGLTLSFTNVASVAAWACNNFFQSGSTIVLDGAPVAASNTTNNTTMTTGAPTTGVAGDYEVLAYAWTSAATMTNAAGMTRDGGGANGTSVTVAIGHNNTIPLGASTTTTAFAPTLSASNQRKTGVGMLLASRRDLPAVASGGGATVSVGLTRKRVLTAGSAGGATANEVMYITRAFSRSSAGGATVSATIYGAPAIIPSITLTDPFTDAAINTGLWTSFGPVTETTSGLEISPATAGTPGGVRSLAPYDVTEHAVQIEIATRLTLAGTEQYLRVESSTSNGWEFGVRDGALIVRRQVAGTTTTQATASWPSGTTYLRVWETDNLLIFDYSANGTAWTTFYVGAL